MKQFIIKSLISAVALAIVNKTLPPAIDWAVDRFKRDETPAED